MSEGPLVAIAAHQYVAKHPVVLGLLDVRLCETHWPDRTCRCLANELEWLGDRPDAEVFGVAEVWPHWSALRKGEKS